VSVLGACLLSSNAVNEVLEILQPEDFYRSAHGVVFEAIQELNFKGHAVDPVVVLDYLVANSRLDEVGGAAAVHGLASTVPTAANAAHYARIVRDRALLRRLIDAGTRIVQIGYEPTDDPVMAVNEAESEMFAVAEGRATNEASQLKDLLNESFAAIEKLADRGDEITGLATGFRDLDRLTAGLQPQNLIILAARPAMGKSSLAMSIVHYVTADLHVPAVLFSLEMSKQEIVMRLLASEAMIDSQRIKTGRLEDHDWHKLGEALGKLSEAPLFIDDTPSINLMEITSKCRRLKQRYGLELIIIDYLQLMQSHRRVESRQQEVAEISRGLKMLAKELNVPVLALSQLNRSPESRTDKRPMLADLRESGCLTPSTRLFRADTGMPITLGELLEADRPVPVWSTTDDGRMVAADVSRAFSSGHKPVYRVGLRSGLAIEATANHPFLTISGYVPLSDLTVGDRVATARRLPEAANPSPMDRDEIVLLAHLIGEGTIVPRQPVHYTSADRANLEAVEKAAFRRFGITARRVPDGRSEKTTQLYLPAPERLTHGRRNPIAAWLDELGLWGCRAADKHLPAEVFALPDDGVRLFLHHLWATDGTLVPRRPDGTGPRVHISYATSSEQLARDVVLLLRRLDLRAKIQVYMERTGRPGYRVAIYGVEQQRRFLSRIGIHGDRGDRVEPALASLEGVRSNPNVDVLPIEIWDDIRHKRAAAGMTEREFQAALGTSYCGSSLYKSAPSRARLQRVAEVLDDDRLAARANDDLAWDEIVAIEPLGTMEVFDATVPGTHNFVAEGVVVHNSMEQDADIVAFIYRDEIYDPDSPDKGIAELLVSKHRNGATGVVKLAFLGHVTKFANLARGAMGGGGAPTPPPPTGGPGGYDGADTPI
jgi:replicative DNA helicase